MEMYKVNLHITENCNYNCRKCFAHFDKKADLSVEEWKAVIDNLKASRMVNAINFAGGEPLLYKGFPELVEYAHKQGFKVSVISNGSLMMNKKVMPKRIYKYLDTLGISIDSFDKNTLKKLGCCCKGTNQVLDEQSAARLFKYVRRLNPDLKIKVNTVVNRLNVNESLLEKGLKLGVDRWKLLRMKPFTRHGFSNFDLAITDEEFTSFVKAHEALCDELVPEIDLSRSYIIFDNKGDMIDNEAETHTIVGNGVTESFTSLMARYKLNHEAYYSHSERVELPAA